MSGRLTNNADNPDSMVDINIIFPITLEPYMEQIFQLDLNILLNERNGHILGQSLQYIVIITAREILQFPERCF